MKDIIFINFSGVYRDISWVPPEISLTCLNLEKLSGTNCYCDDFAAEHIRKELKELNADAIHFIDSGNYHYMTLFWLEKISEPFNLLIFDHHTDMQPPAFGNMISCGGWIERAVSELPYLNKVFLLGPPRQDIDMIPDRLLEKADCLCQEELNDGFSDFISRLPSDLPLYISIDKDILSPDYGNLTWSQGHTTLEELKHMLIEIFYKVRQKGGKTAGIDICGEADIASGSDNTKNTIANKELLSIL